MKRMVNFLSFLKEREDPINDEFSKEKFPDVHYTENDQVYIEDESGKIELSKNSQIRGFD